MTAKQAIRGWSGTLSAGAVALCLVGCDARRPVDPLSAGNGGVGDGGDRPTDTTSRRADTTSRTSGTSRSVAFIWSVEKGTRLIQMPAGAISSGAVDINDAGDVAGTIVAGAGAREAFVWSESLGFRMTGSLENFSSGVVPTEINAAGTLIGYAAPGAGGLAAFVWTRAAGFTPPAGERFGAMAINDAGWIVGFRWLPDAGSFGPARWHQATGFVSLPRTEAECDSPIAINGKNEVLGWSGNELNGMGCWPERWIVWRDFGEPVEVMRCPRTACDHELVGLNNRGEIAGSVADTAFRMNLNGIVTARLPQARASDINETGDVVGQTLPWQSSRPFLWTASGELVLLPLPEGKSRGAATAVNNRGEVVGWAY